MVVVVLFTFVSAGFTHVGACFSDIAVELRARRTELSARGGDSDHVVTETEALLHLLAFTGALIGTVCTDLHGFVTVVDTLAGRIVEQIVDLSHRIQYYERLLFLSCG